MKKKIMLKYQKLQKIIIEVIKMYDSEAVYHKKIMTKKMIMSQKEKKVRIMKMLIQRIILLKKKLKLKEHEKI
jgi:hypothetical protein